jgi:hypothetical protein
MEESLQHVERSIVETWGHIDRQCHIIDILQEHGRSQDVATAELLSGSPCERKAILLEEMQPAESDAEPRLEW